LVDRLDEEFFLHECELGRTPFELKLFTDDQLRRLSSTREGKSAIRLRKGPVKPFMEEILPLSLWATRVYGSREDVRCRWVRGNQSFDAIIIDLSKLPHYGFRLEITLASSGYQERLRSEYADEHGFVPMTGPILTSGTKANRKIDTHLECSSRGDQIWKAYQQVREAIERKASKPYTSGTSLLVMAEDVEFELDSHFDDLDAILLAILKTINPPFDAIFVLGSKGKLAVELSAPNEAYNGWTLRRL
jgi:hypothetical protein